METLKKENELNLVAQQYIINLTNEIKNKMNDFFNNSYNYRYNYYLDFSLDNNTLKKILQTKFGNEYIVSFQKHNINGNTIIHIEINFDNDNSNQTNTAIDKQKMSNSVKSNKKEITNDILNEIINTKQFNELLNYTKFDLSHNFVNLLMKCKDEKILKHVIDNAIDLNCICDEYQCRPIHILCKFSTSKIIQYIIDKDGIELECENNDGWRPIHFICKYSTYSTILNTINKGVNTKFYNNDLKLEKIIKRNNKLSDEEKDKIIKYIEIFLYIKKT
jgi:hypothetical protein